jgi:hypothetical protein
MAWYLIKHRILLYGVVLNKALDTFSWRGTYTRTVYLLMSVQLVFNKLLVISIFHKESLKKHQMIRCMYHVLCTLES